MAGLFRRLPGRAVGSSVGAVFGLVFVIANAGELGRPTDVALRLLGLAAFGACLVGVASAARRSSAAAERARLGRGYWAVVAGEVALILAGRYVLAGPLDRAGVVLPWATLVVGLHFFLLAAVLGVRFYHLLAFALTVCALVGLGLSAAAGHVTSTTPEVAVAAGVCPGFLLLAASLWGLRRPGPRATAAPTPAAGQPYGAD